jgi:glutamyl-tRNA reductase
MRLVLVGTSHHRAPVELREQLFVSAAENRELVERLAGVDAEAVVLSTCNRTELYLTHGDDEAAQARAFAELTALAGLAESEIAPALYTLTDEAAALHVFRVAAGLDSLIPGEAQILGQVRRAYEAAREAGTGSSARRSGWAGGCAQRPRSARTRRPSPPLQPNLPSGSSGLSKGGGSSSWARGR